jgi:peptidoglycan/LPS O-acetylase OafA/YrhL
MRAFATTSYGSHYRPDIDGLRAVAVLSVVVFHAFPGKLTGGFVGVDIFFVISGYLISTIIFESLADGKFSFVDFYSRRIRRIFPALILVLATTYCIGWYVLPPDAFERLGKQTAASMGFFQNFVLWSESGYFDKDSATKPLLHLWSLAVEEQYYLIYPALVAAAWRRKIHPLVLIIAATALSFLLNVYGVQRYPSATYYMPWTRFWEIFAGGILAWIDLFGSSGVPASSFSAQHQSSIARLIASLRGGVIFDNGCALAGGGLILFAILHLNSQSPFPGWRALLPVGGAWLLILAGRGAWINRHILSARLPVFVGLVSYPLYLWHWPLLSFLEISSSSQAEAPIDRLKLGVLVLSFILACVTYLFIERRIRFGFGAHKKALTAALCGLALLVSSVGYATYLEDGLAFRYSEELREIAAYKHVYGSDVRVSEGSRCWLDAARPFQDFSPVCSASLASRSEEPSMVIWGDSHAASLYPGLASLFGGQQGIAQFTRDGCPPVLGAGIDTAPLLPTRMGLGNPNCIESNESVLSVIQRYNPDIVVLFGAWRSYTSRFSDEAAPYVRGLRQTIEQLKKLGTAHILIIGPFPSWQSELPNLVLQDLRKNPIHRFRN